MVKGWFNESRRHALARKGIRTGRKSKTYIRRKDRNPVNERNVVDYIMEYEGGDISEKDYLYLMAYMIKTGRAWTFQGSLYGRPAKELIDAGIISREGRIDWDKYNELKEEQGF